MVRSFIHRLQHLRIYLHGVPSSQFVYELLFLEGLIVGHDL